MLVILLKHCLHAITDEALWKRYGFSPLFKWWLRCLDFLSTRRTDHRCKFNPICQFRTAPVNREEAPYSIRPYFGLRRDTKLFEGLGKVSAIFLFNGPKTAILDLRNFLLHGAKRSLYRLGEILKVLLKAFANVARFEKPDI